MSDAELTCDACGRPYATKLQLQIHTMVYGTLGTACPKYKPR